MIERRIVSTQLINLSQTRPNKQLVAVLTRSLQRDGGHQGTVLLMPRKNSMDRYRPVANAEVVHAAVLAGADSVQALVGEWPADIPELLPIEGLLSQVSSDQIQPPVATVEPTDITRLDPIQRAHYFADQVAHYGSQEKAARQLGVNRSAINNSVQLLKLIPAIQQELQTGQIGESAARTIALADAKHQLQLLDWYLESEPKPTIRELEQSIRFIGDGDFRAGRKLGRHFASLLSENFGCDIRFRPTGKGGWCKVKASDLEAPIVTGILASVRPKHKVKIAQSGWGIELTFKYGDNEDLLSVLPQVESH